MSVDENRALLVRMWEEVFNQGQIEVVDEIVATEYLNHDLVPGESPGSEGLKGFVLYLRNAFPDIHFNIELMVAGDDKVATRWRSTATHQGEFMGISATGIEASLTGMAIHRVENGKIVEAWNNWDALALLTALGAVPQAGGGE